MGIPVIDGILDIGEKLIDKLIPDPQAAAKKKIELKQLAQNGSLKELEHRAGVIMSEAKSEHWLAANWRPITMLVFVALIAAHWLGYSAPNLTEPERIALIDLVKIGLGGYVFGRSAEKGIKAWKQK